MQAIFIISIFSLVLTIMASIISSGTSNTAQLTKQRIEETHAFFEKVAKVTLNDITLNQMMANPANATNPADFIKGMSQLSLLSSGRMGDPSLDAWGKPIQGVIFTEYQSLTNNSDSRVTVPVTGIVLVSGGPDGIVQTPIKPVTSLSGIYGIVVPTGATGAPANDDIIYAFDNSTMQQQALDGLKAHMERIGSAALRELQTRVGAYRQVKLAQYQSDIAKGKDVNISNLDISTDPNAPRFLALDNTQTGLNNRRQLGVDEDFSVIEETLPNGGQLVLNAPTPVNATDPLVITVTNSSNNPTPWGTKAVPLQYVIKVSPKAS